MRRRTRRTLLGSYCLPTSFPHAVYVSGSPPFRHGQYPLSPRRTMFLPSIDPSQMVSSKFLASSATSVYGRPSNEQSMGGGKRTKKSHKPKFDRWLPSVRIRLAGSPAVDGCAPSRPPVAPPVHGPPLAPPLALEKEAPNTCAPVSFTRCLASIKRTLRSV